MFIKLSLVHFLSLFLHFKYVSLVQLMLDSSQCILRVRYDIFHIIYFCRYCYIKLINMHVVVSINKSNLRLYLGVL